MLQQIVIALGQLLEITFELLAILLLIGFAVLAGWVLYHVIDDAKTQGRRERDCSTRKTNR